MCKPIYEDAPHRWQDPDDTPAINEPLTPGNEANIYGEVIFERGEFRIRFDGEVYSAWMGKSLEATIKDRELAETLIEKL